MTDAVCCGVDGEDGDIPERAAEASINRDESGNVLGCPLFLGRKALQQLDIGDGAETLEYWVERDGTVLMRVRGDTDE